MADRRTTEKAPRRPNVAGPSPSGDRRDPVPLREVVEETVVIIVHRYERTNQVSAYLSGAVNGVTLLLLAVAAVVAMWGEGQ